MPIAHVFGLFFNPARTWGVLRDKRYSLKAAFFGHTAIMALIPAISGFWGTTRIGWQIGVGDVTRLTDGSALRIAIAYYFAMVVATFSVGWMVHWMSKTYGADQPLSQCFVLATFTATPLFLVGLMQVYPLLWLNLIVGLPALGYTVYIFYTGVPEMMAIPPERGFLFSSAVMGFGLVALVAMLAVTALLWGAGFAPSFSR